MDKIIFWGASGQARVLRECIEGTTLQLVALFDNDSSINSPFADVPLHHGWDGFAGWLAQQPAGPKLKFLIAIGGEHGSVRIDLHERLERAGLSAATAIHRTAHVADSARIAPGCQVLAHAAVCVDAVLERSCIVNTSASVDHECVLHDGVHVAPGAHLAGCVIVRRHSMIGIGAVVLPRVTIGANSVVGAGAVVTRDVPDNVVVVGNPARVVSSRNS